LTLARGATLASLQLLLGSNELLAIHDEHGLVSVVQEPRLTWLFLGGSDIIPF